MKALIYEGRVCDLQIEEFPVHPSMLWVPAPDGVAAGWSYADGAFTPPPVHIDGRLHILIDGVLELAPKPGA